MYLLGWKCISVSYFSVKYIQLHHMKKYLTECDRGKAKNREARLRTAKSEDFEQVDQIWRLTWLNNVHFMWCLSDYLVLPRFYINPDKFPYSNKCPLPLFLRYPVLPHTFVSPSADSRGTVVSYWQKCVHEVLVLRGTVVSTGKSMCTKYLF